LIKQWISIVTLQINPFYDGLRDDWSIDDYHLLSGAYKLYHQYSIIHADEKF
jgi:hypothetical protein